MEYSIDPARDARQPAYRRIAEGLRDEILAEKLKPGTKLPATDELATIWKTSVFTTHKALVALVKEGWVQRLHGSGTYVAQPKNRFFCAGIYHGADICSNRQPPFVRSVHESLLEQLGRKKKEVLIFLDARPQKDQTTILPALADAIQKRRIQCLVAPTINTANFPALTKLALPIAFVAYSGSANRVNFDEETLLRQGAHALKVQGCKSVGIISPLNPRHENAGPFGKFFNHFEKALRDEGLKTRDEWIFSPSAHEYEKHGYASFQKLWALREKPDGLIVYPDVVANGAITAILEIGMESVTRQVKFVFHRNAHTNFLCPFPVTWAISDEDTLAAGLIEQIEKQFKGAKTTPILLPYVFKKTASFV